MKSKKILFPLLFSITLFFSATTFAQGYLYKTDFFSIRFPGEPYEGMDEVPTEAGIIEMYSVMYEEGTDKVYLVAYSDFPKGYMQEGSEADMLDGAVEGSYNTLGDPEILKNEAITFDGHPARFLKAKGDNKVLCCKFILVENRLYQVLILKVGSHISNQEIESFTNTFKLL